MPQDAEVLALLEMRRSAPALPPSVFDRPEEALEYIKSLRAQEHAPQPTITVQYVEDRIICEHIPVRIYRNSSGILPMVLYFHGGGWATGTLDSQDELCRRIAVTAQCVVVSVDYRLAPEYPFPAPLDDAYEATRWVAEHAETIGGDPQRWALVGGSSGANLAAAVSLRLQEERAPGPVFQVLIYPPLEPSLNSDSATENGEGYILTTARMKLFWQLYAPNREDWSNPLVAPLRAASLAGMPPTLLEAAEFDPLLDDAKTFAQVLERDGVDVELTVHEELLHGFTGHTQLIARADRAVESIVERIKLKMGELGKVDDRHHNHLY